MEINTVNSGKKINMIKVPKYLGEVLNTLQSQMDIGRVTISENGKIEFLLNKHIEQCETLPVNYDIKKVNRVDAALNVVTSTPSLSCVDGAIENEFIMTPCMNDKYIEFKKNMFKRRVHNTEVLDSTHEGVRVEKMGNLREMEHLARKRKQMLIDKKRERLDKKDVLDIVFNAFEKYESWTVKDLADFTGQPLAFIQEIVNEICNADKKEHKCSYTLKDEYK